MRFALAPEHRVFFKKNQFIHFVDLLSEQEVEAILSAAQTTLAKRMNTSISKLDKNSSASLLAKGLDLWREDDVLKKRCLQRSLGEIGVDLFHTRPLRIAYTRFLMKGSDALPIEKFFPFKAIQGVCGSILLQLGDDSTMPFPCTKGGALFVSPNAYIPFLVEAPMLQIVYGSEQLRYLPKTKEEEIPLLKTLGYHSGELLKDAQHPIVFF